MHVSPLTSAERPLTVDEREWSRPAEGAIYHAAFSPDRMFLATASDGGAQLWSLEDAPPVGPV